MNDSSRTHQDDRQAQAARFAREMAGVQARIDAEIAALPPELIRLLWQLQRLCDLGYLDPRTIMRRLPEPGEGK